MSDMRHIANSLSQYGRKGDTELVHMSKNEVQALGLMSPQGQLSRNPHTGLHEAFSLEDLIGPIAGIAAAIFAPELLPFIAGANGIAVGADTGDLGKGLMAGLTTYGLGAGAGALGGAMGLGAGAGAADALSTGAGEFAGLGPQTAWTGATGGGLGGSVGLGGSFTSQLGADFAGGAANPGAALGASQTAALGASQAADYSALDTPFQAAAKATSSGPLGNVGGWIADHPMMTAGGIMALGAMSPNGTNYPSSAMDQAKGPSTPLVQGPVARPASMPGGYSPGYGAEQNFFPQQGNLAMASPAYVQQAQQLNALQAPNQSLLQAVQGGGGLGSDAQQAQTMLQRRQMGMADGGIVTLPKPTLNHAIQSAAPTVSGPATFNPTGGYVGYSMGQPGSVAQAAPQALVAPPPPPGGGEPVYNVPTLQSSQPAQGWTPMPYTPDPQDPNAQYYAPNSNDTPYGNYDGRFNNDNYFAAGGPVYGHQDDDRRMGYDQVGIKSMAGGGSVMGPGDGTSDSVPATINGVAPVQLATDEHVLSADVVSGLGNGSSNAGHKALEAMARRVRSARSNGKKMPRTISPRKFLPA